MLRAAAERLAIAVGRQPVVRRLLRTRAAAHVVGMIIALSVRPLNRNGNREAIRVLVFSAPRFMQDIGVMARHPRLQLYAINRRALEIVQAIFSEPGRPPGKDFYLERDPVVLSLRERKRVYISVIASYLRLRGLDSAITPSIQYWIEQDWAAGLNTAGLPFVGLHKEFTILDGRQLEWRINVHRNRKQKFLGSHLLVTNDIAKELFSRSGVFPANKISVMGLIRMDRLFRPDSQFRNRTVGRRQAVLFSFGHFSGGIGSPDRRSHYFSRNDDFGFVELFTAVHSAFAELATANPDVEFLIKPKNVEDWWVREIDGVVAQATGRSISEISNLSISSLTAPELIRDADVVVGFNSTVLLESLALGRNTVFPMFAEALTKYPDNVYLVNYQDMFTTAHSKAELISLIQDGLSNPERYRPHNVARLQEMMRRYLGFDDGRSLERFVTCLENIKAARGAEETRI